MCTYIAGVYYCYIAGVYYCTMCVGASRSQKRELEPLELKFQGIVRCLWVLGSRLRSSARAANAESFLQPYVI